MNFRTFLATAGGIIVAFATVYIFEMIGMKLFPPAEKFKITNLEDLKRMLDGIPVAALVIVALGHGLSVFFGAIAANKIHPGSIVGFIVIFALMVFGTVSNLFALPHPTWFIVTDIASLLLGGLAGWKLLKWKN